MDSSGSSSDETFRPRSAGLQLGSPPRDMLFTDGGTVPHEYCCSKCGGMLCDPVLTGCCGRNMCLSCMDVKKGGKCPLCGAPGLSYVQDQRVVREMRAAIVFCKNKEKGCNWLGSIQSTKEHLETDCQHTDVTCSTCKCVVSRGDLPNHLEANCYIQWSQCAYCKHLFPMESLESQHLLECREYIQACPNGCGSEIKRCEAAEHGSICPNLVVDCQFKMAGCSASHMRKDEAKHLKEKHIDHSVLSYLSMQQQTRKLEEQLNQTRKELASFKEEMETTNQVIAKIGIDLTNLRASNKEMSDLLQSELQFFLHQPHNSPMKNLSIECMRLQLAYLGDPSSLILSPNRSLVFRLSMYSYYKSNNLVWYSQPFIVRNGYQMCIAVHLGGDQEGQGTHISIHLHLMAGSMDNKLTWPLNFNEMVTVSLTNQAQGGGGGGAGSSASLKSDSSPLLARIRSKSDDSPTPYATQQTLRTVVHLLHRVNKPAGEIGLSFSYCAMFYSHKNIGNAVLVNDSLVFMVELKNPSTTLGKSTKAY